MGEGNIFTGACLFTGVCLQGGFCLGRGSPYRSPQKADPPPTLPPQKADPHSPQKAVRTEYDQYTVGTHPTGMHSCIQNTWKSYFKNNEKIPGNLLKTPGKSWKYHGILSVRKNGNPDYESIELYFCCSCGYFLVWVLSSECSPSMTVCSYGEKNVKKGFEENFKKTLEERTQVIQSVTTTLTPLMASLVRTLLFYHSKGAVGLLCSFQSRYFSSSKVCRKMSKISEIAT